MQCIDSIYINGEFVTPHGEDVFDLFNPATEDGIGRVRLADEEDARHAIAAARAAFPAWSRTSRDERIAALERMQAALRACESDLLEAIVTEYGAPAVRGAWMARYPADVIAATIETLRDFTFVEQAGAAQVIQRPLGVAGLITPWNSDAGFICSKLAAALAAGCTAVIKPSEMSALQTRIVSEALHRAGLPAGVFNIVTGRGDVVGEEICRHPDVAKISFTGSTDVGKHIVQTAAATLKRVTLELGGKSPTIVLDDADLGAALPLALLAGFMNSGQACVAGSRLLVPESRLAEFEALIVPAVSATRCGDPHDAATVIGPMVSRKQWERVQGYIQAGIEEGARLLVGGPGRPEGLDRGWYVRPTVFTDVRNEMRIAREEIFGPVLAIIPYRDDEQAVAIANDTRYGLSAVVLGGGRERAAELAGRIESGRVLVNTLVHEPMAPFGGFKQSGIGREMGKWGLAAYLEPQSVLIGG
jgi:aldehyde dehydrogenase (NAD+)